MTPDDRAAAQWQQQTIATSAQFYGYRLDSSFTYREIACPVAPDHLLLAYEATSPNGSVSRFTAVVRRGAEKETDGRHSLALIIPILHFGVVPFIPAIANPHSIEVFNAAISTAPSAIEVLADTQAGRQPLLVRSLCYLAMVGEEPAALGSPSLDPATIQAPIPTLVFQDRGKIMQLISVRSSANSCQVWALTFQSAGKLLSATREQHPIDRTPIVLNAANNGSPGATGATNITAGAGHVSSQPMTPPAPATSSVATVPVAPAESTALPHAPPAPGSASATTTAPAPPPPAVSPSMAEAPRPPAPEAPAASAEIPHPPAPAPAENTAPVSEPVTAQVSSPAATPAMAAPPSPPASPVATTALPPGAPAATSPAAEMPQPPEPTSAPASAAIPKPAAPAARAMVTPVVEPSPPLPLGRFIANPPQPPSRFIPDSALKNPPHLPQ